MRRQEGSPSHTSGALSSPRCDCEYPYDKKDELENDSASVASARKPRQTLSCQASHVGRGFKGEFDFGAYASERSALHIRHSLACGVHIPKHMMDLQL